MGVVLVLVSTCATGWYPEIADFEAENTITLSFDPTNERYQLIVKS
jgi:hypothetical protein